MIESNTHQQNSAPEVDAQAISDLVLLVSFVHEVVKASNSDSQPNERKRLGKNKRSSSTSETFLSLSERKNLRENKGEIAIDHTTQTTNSERIPRRLGHIAEPKESTPSTQTRIPRRLGHR